METWLLLYWTPLKIKLTFFHRRQKAIQIWNIMGVSKSRQNHYLFFSYEWTGSIYPGHNNGTSVVVVRLHKPTYQSSVWISLASDRCQLNGSQHKLSKWLSVILKWGHVNKFHSVEFMFTPFSPSFSPSATLFVYVSCCLSYSSEPNRWVNIDSHK